MNAGSIGDPDIYLVAKVKPMKMNNGVTAWAISQSKYVNEAVIKCEKWVICLNTSIAVEQPTYFQQTMTLILHTTVELDEEQATYY